MHTALLNFSYGVAQELAAQSVSVFPGPAFNADSTGMTDFALGVLALGQASWDLSSLAYHTWTGQNDSKEEAPWQKTASSILKLSTGCSLIMGAYYGRGSYYDTVMALNLVARLTSSLGQASWDLSSLAYHTWTGQYDSKEEAPWQKTVSSILTLSTGCSLIMSAYAKDPYSSTILGVSLVAQSALSLLRIGQNAYTELFLGQGEMRWKSAGRSFAGGVLASHSMVQGSRLLNASIKELTSPRHESLAPGFRKRVPKWCEDAIDKLQRKWPHDHPTCGEVPSYKDLYWRTDLLYRSSERWFDMADDVLHCKVESIRRLSLYLSGEEICLAYSAEQLNSRYAWHLGRHYAWQVDSLHQGGDKVAVVARAISDRNGAYRDTSRRELIGPGIEELYRSARVTAAYTENMADVCSALQKATHRHGKNVDTLVISAHGYPFGFRLGNQNVVSLFTDLSCLNDYLSKNATVVLDSCGTAWKGGLSRLNIAKWIALSAPGRTVVASPYLSYYSTLHLSGDQWQFRHGSEDCAMKYYYRPGLEHRQIYHYESTTERALAMIQKKAFRPEDFFWQEDKCSEPTK